MKISTRISLLFSIVSSLVLVAFGISVYAYTKNHINSDFEERLKKRVDITENFFLEKETFSKQEFEKIKEQFFHTLNNEKEEVVDITKTSKPKFKYTYSKQLKYYLLNNDNYVFNEKGRQGASKIFNVGNKKYLIIVTAFNDVGKNYLSFLLNQIQLLIVLGVIILFFLSILISKRILLPISKKIKHANLISANNLHERLKVVNAKDELGQMAIAFNDLLDRLEKSFEAQKSFISNASHEIKNPLTAIMGEAEIASSKDRKTEDYLESFSIILTQAERLNLTVNNLLQLSKINDGGIVKFEKLILMDYIIELITSYNFINPKNKILITKIESSVTINGNRGLLKTAFINLLDNACKFSDNKKVEISISVVNDKCLLVIKDKGIGIPKDDLNKISNPFYRAKNTTSIKGSGIGLSLTKKIIEIHNGSLKIESIENKGTTIFVSLPSDL